jgi:Zinc carboxypeptidase
VGWRCGNEFDELGIAKSRTFGKIFYNLMKATTCWLLAFLMISSLSSAQTDVTLARRLHDAHDSFKEKTLAHRRFKHRDIVPLLNKLTTPLAVTTVGESFEKRAIYQVKAGNGPAKVLFWSQMHGDEATATMALFDIFNFLQAKNDAFDDLRQRILTKTTLYFVPMLNPDGAERWQRRTALDIDMNRDAVRLQSPESRLLKNLQQTLQPLVGFNLHDQNPRYGVGRTGKQATLSFLATAFDEARSINLVRKRSMQLIAGMNRVLQPFIPGQIGRYDDEFEPRAFGDNIQKWGTTLILIESGGYANDPEKQYIRKLNFVAMLSALDAIATGSYEQENIADYATISENGRTLFDVLIRNVQTTQNGQPITLDLGINRYEINTNGANSFYYRSQLDDLGDLSTFHGLQEIDATGLTLAPAKLHSDTLNAVADLQKLDLAKLRQQGVVAFRLRQGKRGPVLNAPVHLLHEGILPANPLRLGQVPTFLLKQGNEIRQTWVNGFLVDDKQQQPTGLVD